MSMMSSMKERIEIKEKGKSTELRSCAISMLVVF